MKKSIHPTYYSDVVVQCACGATLTTGSVIPGPLKVEICSQCHPFFTGEKKLIDTEGRVEKFERVREQAKVIQAKKKPKVDETPQAPRVRKSLREMLSEVE